jgi:hypothetical protein
VRSSLTDPAEASRLAPTRARAAEFSHGGAVSAAAPRPVDSGGARRALTGALARTTTAGRAQPEDIAQVIALQAPRAGYVTGVTIAAGGRKAV